MDTAQAAPTAPQTEAAPQIQMEDDFSSLRDAIRQAPEAKTEQQTDPVMKQEKTAEKPQKQQEEKAENLAENKPKSLKEKLKVEEEAAEEEASETQEEGEDDIPTYKNRVATEKEKATWKGLKQVKEEYEKLKPEFEKLKAEYEEFKKKPVFDDEVTKELEDLRRFRDMTDFKLSETYQNEIAQPISEIDTDISEMVSEFHIDKDGLAKAFTEISEWKRNLAIEKVLKEADDEVPTAIAKTILDKANELHKIWKKEADLEENAAKNRAAYEHEKKQTVTKQTLEEQKAWQTAVESSTKMIETQMGPLLKQLPQEQRAELLSALKEAKIADTPEDRALQAQAPHLAAVLIEQLNGMRKELSDLRKANKALSAATPSSNGRQSEAKKPAADEDDDALFQAIRGQYGR